MKHPDEIMEDELEAKQQQELFKGDAAVHKAHCYQGEYEDSCKYGENNCPAKPTQETVKDACKRMLKE